MSAVGSRRRLSPSLWVGMVVAAVLAVLVVQFTYQTWALRDFVCRDLIVIEDGRVVTPACALPSAPAWAVLLAAAVGAAAAAAAALVLTRRAVRR